MVLLAAQEIHHVALGPTGPRVEALLAAPVRAAETALIEALRRQPLTTGFRLTSRIVGTPFLRSPEHAYSGQLCVAGVHAGSDRIP
jgi:hypothetical protein